MENVDIVSKDPNVSTLISQIRALGAGLYDIQKLRISTGNRICASYYSKMGIKPSEKKPDDEKGQKDKTESIVNDLVEELKIVDAYVSEKKCRVKSAIVALHNDKRIEDYMKSNSCTYSEAVLALHSIDLENNKLVRKYQKEHKCSESEAAKALNLGNYVNEIILIRDEADYMLTKSYRHLVESEELTLKQLETLVVQHPLNDLFFSHVKGCGPKASYAILAYLNPYKAKYASSFYMYAGLDTIQDTDENGRKIYWTVEDKPRKVVENIGAFDDYGEPIYTVLEDKSEYKGRVEPCEHGRKKGDVVDVEYVAKDGTTKTKKGITYNPILKTKLIGVLAGNLLKAQDPIYANIYYDYKRRLSQNHRYDSYSDGHIHNMAIRYMIKQFLRNLWVVWRTYEGLEIAEPFEVAKLGNKPHKFNEFHYNMAKIASGNNEAVINYTGTPNTYTYESYLEDAFGGKKGKIEK